MRALILLLAFVVATTTRLSAQTHLVVVSGLSGEPKYAEQFQRWGAAMVDAARGRYGLPADRIVYLAEQPDLDRTRINGVSTRENVERTLGALAGRTGPSDGILILLIGHGSSDDSGPRLNLPGPDLAAADLARMLRRFPTQRVVIANTTSASGDFQQALAGANRVVITATKSGMERNETIFGRFFVDAFAGAGADADKDGRASVLEAFDYAQREVERHYTSEGHLQTEHPQLAGDRETVRGFFLSGSNNALPAATTPELRALLNERQRLENEVQALKGRKDQLEPARYLEQLEQVLVALALKTREIRAKAGGR